MQRQGKIRKRRKRKAREKRERRDRREREEREIRKRAEREARERGDMAAAVLAPAQENPLWQCEHFKRHCSVMFPCCGVFYPCHCCHNESGECDSSNKKANQATHIKCANCGHKGEVSGQEFF